MQRIYFDNAATTPLDADVLAQMLPYLTEQYGNPSSIYSYGREARMAIEKSRKSVAKILNAKPGEIFFTSCGTESTNSAIEAACRDLNCKHIITSPVEHHATLHSAVQYAKLYNATVSYVQLTDDGHIDYAHLESLLQLQKEKTLVTLMHANNEIGNVTDIYRVGELCRQYGAYFHTDAVQSVGHLLIDLQKIHVHFLSASAHKFHGPKGSGLLYIKQEAAIKPFIYGGAQERNMRAGTENVTNIVGFSSALEKAISELEQNKNYIESLKEYMLAQLSEKIASIHLHGDTSAGNLYTVINVGFPLTEKTEMLSINLDIAGICVSGGSACSSGAQGGSHVIKALSAHSDCVPIRFSFSKYNTTDEIDKVVQKISELL